MHEDRLSGLLHLQVHLCRHVAANKALWIVDLHGDWKRMGFGVAFGQYRHDASGMGDAPQCGNFYGGGGAELQKCYVSLRHVDNDAHSIGRDQVGYGLTAPYPSSHLSAHLDDMAAKR